MLPNFTLSGVLPPFHPELGPTADHIHGRSPYVITPEELVAVFATTEERKSLLRDLFQYRQQLRELGFVHGQQWIDGSFVEDVELQRGRPPGDIDLLTFLVRPHGVEEQTAWAHFLDQHFPVMEGNGLGPHCFFDLSLPPVVVVRQSVFWFGLFSHQRETALWKGIVQIDIGADDNAAIALLEEDANAN